MRIALLILVLSATYSFAESPALQFDTSKLCQWQHESNSMDVAECTKLEDEGKLSVAHLEPKSDNKRIFDCITETLSFAKDSGFPSYTLYASCLKDGPGNL